VAKDLAKTNPDTLFLVDNGGCLCGKHLGTTARFTGRDISGQRILKLTPALLASEPGFTPTCEMCP
jgi:hypothetical protein